MATFIGRQVDQGNRIWTVRWSVPRAAGTDAKTLGKVNLPHIAALAIDDHRL